MATNSLFDGQTTKVGKKVVTLVRILTSNGQVNDGFARNHYCHALKIVTKGFMTKKCNLLAICAKY
jgi:hypothetical protein